MRAQQNSPDGFNVGREEYPPRGLIGSCTRHGWPALASIGLEWLEAVIHLCSANFGRDRQTTYLLNNKKEQARLELSLEKG